jgi:hypothetical protein
VNNPPWPTHVLRVPADACLARIEAAPFTCLLDGDVPDTRRDAVAVPEQDVLILTENTAMTLQVPTWACLYLSRALPCLTENLFTIGVLKINTILHFKCNEHATSLLQYFLRLGLLDEEDALLAAINQYASLVGKALASQMLLRVE